MKNRESFQRKLKISLPCTSLALQATIRFLIISNNFTLDFHFFCNSKAFNTSPETLPNWLVLNHIRKCQFYVISTHRRSFEAVLWGHVRNALNIISKRAYIMTITFMQEVTRKTFREFLTRSNKLMHIFQNCQL